ncbi:MAG: DUF3450 family protein [Planctomycetota bacterium]
MDSNLVTSVGLRLRVLSCLLAASAGPFTVGRAVAQESATGSAPPQATEASSSSKLELARANLEKWVETRKLISKERADWTVGRSVLTERIEMVKREIEIARGKIADADKSLVVSDKSKGELSQQKAALDQAATVLRNTVRTLEERTLLLLPRLPAPLQEKVKNYSQRIQTDVAEAEKSQLSDRFANVASVLNEVNKWNREVTVTSEVRALPNGTNALARVMYVGIGQAYFATQDGKVAGVGTVGTEGWVWTPTEEHAADIAKAIAVHQNEQPAAFVGVPLKIQ